ncbi:MAG: radical SAM family heme chaperone HemW [Planktomarina sp.]
MVEDWQQGGFGLYVHWPFCQAKCPYCDFNSHVSGTVDHDQWEKALLSELDRNAALTPNRVLNSIFFGGGTPSLMRPKTVEALINRATEHWTPANDIEITLEANPTSIEADNFKGFRAAGVNRVSVGIQALNDPDLKKLGRLHSVAEAMTALDIARSTFDRFSFDLIYARQDQSLDDWQAELTRALDLADGHLSLYQLTIEPGTAFGFRAAKNKLPGLPDEDLSADMFEVTNQVCAEQGMHAYEVSNYALDGMQSTHNLIYWKSGDYVGIGPGAHGRLSQGQNRIATETALAPTAWMDRVHKLGSGNTKSETLTTADRANEMLMMGLRVTEGVSINRVEALMNKALVIPGHLVELGFITNENGQLIVTDQGRPLLNQIIQSVMY